MKVSYEGFGEKVATFEAETTGNAAVVEGCLVKMCGNGKVCAVTAAAEIPIGVALSVRDGYASVQVGGYMKAPCTASMTVGWHHLASNASKALADISGGRSALVVEVNSGVCGVIF